MTTVPHTEIEQLYRDQLGLIVTFTPEQALAWSEEYDNDLPDQPRPDEFNDFLIAFARRHGIIQ